jgi:hypothetical protein
MKEKSTEWEIIEATLNRGGIPAFYDGETWHIANVEAATIDSAIEYGKTLLASKGVVL